MRRFTFALSAALALTALPAAATSFVMVSDEKLADEAAVIVEARILTVDDAPVTGTPSTDYLVEVQRVLKGDIPGSALIVRVPGGTRPDGVTLRVWGMPRFKVGENALLFLVPGAEGTYRIAELMLGAFHFATLGGRPALIRDLSETIELPAPGAPAGTRARFHQARDRERFVAWLVDRTLGTPRGEDYFLTADASASTAGPVVDHYSFFEYGGYRLRWFEFDGGGHEPWRVYADGQPGLTAQETIDAFKAGMSVWNNDAATDVSYTYGGTTSSYGRGLNNTDGHNSIIFGDPLHESDDFPEPFDCQAGMGVLAVGGVFPVDGPVQTHNGEQFAPIAEGDIVTNANIDCFFAESLNKVKAAEELFGHELGHTLGLGHSCDDPSLPCDPEALMYPFIHDDGRGAKLTNDDRAGLFALYGIGTLPAAPSNLGAELTSATQAHLTWQDNADNETSFKVEWKPPGAGGFSQLASVAANTVQYVAGGLSADATYSFRVRAINAIGASSPSNTVQVDTSSPPAAPSGLTAAPAGATSISLSWSDNSGNETGFLVQGRSPLSEYSGVYVSGPDVTGVTLTGLTPGLPMTFRVQAFNAQGSSAFSGEASATPVAGTPSTCAAADDTLCLLDGRFQVRVQWRNQHLAGDHGIGHAQPFPGSTKTGMFWFFNPDNVELIVKSLDGGPVNGHFWLFYGALSDVEYWVTVIDTATGDSKTYRNEPGQICGVPDTAAFLSPQPASAGSAAAELVSKISNLSVRASVGAPATAGSCAPDATTLCLQNGRFSVHVDWTDQRTLTHGVGTAIAGNEESGFFWFFNDQNIELVTKVLDARSINGSFWFFYGALSDVFYTITVEDTVTGLSKPYTNQPGDFCGAADTVGFPDTL